MIYNYMHMVVYICIRNEKVLKVYTLHFAYIPKQVPVIVHLYKKMLLT